MATIATGNNIKFLHGSIEALNQMTASIPGAFYITDDSYEMFLGVDSTKKPVALNRYVDIYDKWSDITALGTSNVHTGKFYYAKEENILGIFDGKVWTQINPDTNTKVGTVSITKGTPTASSIPYTLTINNVDQNNQAVNTVTANFEISSDDITKLVVSVSVGLKSSVSGGTATIATTGAGANPEEEIQISGSNGVSIEEGSVDNSFIIKGTKYTLESSSTNITLKENGSVNVGTVTINGDNTWTEAVGTTANEIVIKHKNVDHTTTTPSKSLTPSERTFDAITKVTPDNAGHIIEIETTSITLPDADLNDLGLGSTTGSVTDGINTVDYTTSISLQRDGANLDTEDIVTAHTITVDGTKTIVQNGGDFGSFYSASKIDTKLKAVDAMVYKGTVATFEDLPTIENSDVAVGWTYKASQAFELNGKTVNIGDILIANGTESTDGTITSNLSWDIIESGADTDTTYTLTASGDKITLDGTTGADSVLTLDDDDIVFLISKDNIITAKHKKYNVDPQEESSTLAYGGTFSVDIVAKDDYGHVEGITRTTYTLPAIKANDTIVAANDTLSFKNGDSTAQGSLTITDVDNNPITVTNTVNNTNGGNLSSVITHNVIEPETPDAIDGGSLALNGTITVVDSLTDDSFGHITSINTKKYTLAGETTYTLETPVLNSNQVLWNLKNNKTAASAGNVTFKSDSLTFAVNNGVTSVDLVWGSF